MRLSLALILAFAAAPALAAERSFPVGDFEQIVLTGSTDVRVTTGGRVSVVAEGAAADLDRMDIRVDGKRLLIGTKKGSGKWSSREGVKVRVSVPKLSAATISGSGDIGINRVSGPFGGRISGSGDMDIASVDSPALSLAVSGSGDIDVGGGRCGQGSFTTTGSGEIDAARVRCETVSATVTGSGNIDAQATGTAALNVTGSGNVVVTGGARCTTRTTGSGTTRCS
ncbi:DUF2807 domain-containing protein [Sandaracinobacter sp. RS1-74]|uniref:head GIN domain-containing protein n=1 Tax=Sandaracinobacteroides sayramensis TaxID=2913411 RepID=UPI001EDC6862|nr:head GIN domain-containing protein [Sandaracinobacteroides sayramensis]MCG2842470.1 DUF2807 domain-containing protein [Sandaracinobacteroides sayramensis]